MKHRKKYMLKSENTTNTFEFGAYSLRHVCEVVDNLRQSLPLNLKYKLSSATLYDPNGDVVPHFEQQYQEYLASKNRSKNRRQKNRKKK